ncbi:MAG TPA: HemK2/MTQ2 family protein methyltransferase [Candidatus Norongarragalinales archaeon]|nr:HemK2/MTQ2 family protein methyltransferase [Candidatus Norongarragalinales archaeon]
MTSPGKQKKIKKPEGNTISPFPSVAPSEAADICKWNGLNLTIPKSVYFPHEDSFLLADAAKANATGRVLDFGCGSGIAGIYAASSSAVKELVFSDISKAALECAKSNIKRNKSFPCGCASKAKFIECDLFANLNGEKFDTILFNPPYLPTSKEEKLKGKINAAFDGGIDGRKVVDRFLAQFPKHLEKGGVLLYLDSSVTNSRKTEKWLKEAGFSIKILSSQRFFFEELRVLKVSK